jgi:hypothetical protein
VLRPSMFPLMNPSVGYFASPCEGGCENRSAARRSHLSIRIELPKCSNGSDNPLG